MKKNIIRMICGVSIVALALHSSMPIFATSIKEAEEKKQEIEKNITDSQSILDNLETLKSDADAYVVAADEQLEAITAEIVSLQSKQAEKQTQIEETQAKLKKQEEDIEVQYAAMKKRIQFMFENGNTFYLEMMFGTDSISDMLNKAEYITELEEYDREMLNKMEETQKSIEETKATLLSEQAELKELELEQQKQQETVEALIADKEEEIAIYQQQIADTQTQLEEQQKQLAEEEALIEQMKAIEAQRAAAAAAAAAAQGSVATSFVSTGQVFIWPCDATYITSEFGGRTDPITGETAYHSGLDIGASYGSDIYAVADGEVAWSYYSASAGNWIGIDHGNNVYSVYMHCSLSIVSPGEIVKQGQVIGYVGSTGRSTGPHLHLSIRVNGEYVDPHMYVG